jgi:hypothetical protein
MLLSQTLKILLLLLFQITGASRRGIRMLSLQSESRDTKTHSTNIVDDYRVVQFKSVGVGELVDADGMRLAFTAYQGSDGTKLTAIRHEFPSQTKAEEYFDRAIKQAVTVVSSGKKEDRTGKIVGKRAQVVLPSGKVKAKALAVLWTSGGHFHEIVSSSLGNILLLEKQISD